jgi:SAM-dependent methyltransferase
MTFVVSADAYDSYMGRYARTLAPVFADFAGVQAGVTALDVGCGPGALTSELARRLGPGSVAAVDPSETFVEACARRVPGADVRRGSAEALPWPSEAFDAALSQLVVNFMAHAAAGAAEMKRVVRRGGRVAACTWDYAGRMQMLRTFWDGALALDADAPDEARLMRYIDPDELARLWERSGLGGVETAPLDVEATYDGFDDYWTPFTTGTGPGGAYCLSLEPDRREALREECRRRLGDPHGVFVLTARAWAVRGTA